MIDTITSFWQYEFFRNALAAGILASIACGIIGSYVVVKRIALVAGGISHTAYGGIGLGFFLGINPIVGAAVFSLAAAFIIVWIRQKSSQYEDTLIAIMWAMGMAIGIYFIGKTPGYAPNLMSYLFGNILTIPTDDLLIVAILDLIIAGSTVLLFKEFRALTFDEEHARIAGLPTTLLNLLLFCLVSLTVVALIRAVGVILVIALLTIPAAIAVQYCRNLQSMMTLSIGLGAVFTTIGLMISATENIASGATIVFVAGIAYLISFFARPFISRFLPR